MSSRPMLSRDPGFLAFTGFLVSPSYPGGRASMEMVCSISSLSAPPAERISAARCIVLFPPAEAKRFPALSRSFKASGKVRTGPSCLGIVPYQPLKASYASEDRTHLNSFAFVALGRENVDRKFHARVCLCTSSGLSPPSTATWFLVPSAPIGMYCAQIPTKTRKKNLSLSNETWNTASMEYNDLYYLQTEAQKGD